MNYFYDGGNAWSARTSWYLLTISPLFPLCVITFSDPVAYRLESLLLSPDLSESELPSPMYLTVPGQNVRLHVKAMQIGDVVRKSFLDKKSTGTSTWGALLESAVAVVGSQSETSQVGKRGEGGAGKAGGMTFPLGGTSSRVDFSLQPGAVESDYIRYVLSINRMIASGLPSLTLRSPLSSSPVLSQPIVLTLPILTSKTFLSVSLQQPTKIVHERHVPSMGRHAKDLFIISASVQKSS